RVYDRSDNDTPDRFTCGAVVSFVVRFGRRCRILLVRRVIVLWHWLSFLIRVMLVRSHSFFFWYVSHNNPLAEKFVPNSQSHSPNTKSFPYHCTEDYSAMRFIVSTSILLKQLQSISGASSSSTVLPI